MSFSGSYNRQNEALFNKAEQYRLQHRDGEAIQYYKEVLYTDPTNVKAWTYIGVCFMNLGEFQKAINCFDTVIDADLPDLYYQEKYIAKDGRTKCLANFRQPSYESSRSVQASRCPVCMTEVSDSDMYCPKCSASIR